MDKWFKDILPDKDPYHNRGRTTNIYWRNSNLFSTTHPTFLHSCPFRRSAEHILFRAISLVGKIFGTFLEIGMKSNHFWDDDKRSSFLKLARYCKISSRSEDSLFVFWRLFHTFMHRHGMCFRFIHFILISAGVWEADDIIQFYIALLDFFPATL
jgi:hypothetical protein